MPDQFRIRLPTEEVIEEIQLFQLPYQTEIIDLRSLKKYTDFEIPASVTIVPPVLSAFGQVTVLVGLFGNIDDPQMLVILAGNYDSDEVFFFIDHNRDWNLDNDNGPIPMQRGDQPLEVSITSSVFSYKILLELPQQKVPPRRAKKRTTNSIVVGSVAGIGIGGLSYSNTIYQYEVRSTEKNIGLSLSYYSEKIVVGVDAIIQNHYHYTSYAFRFRGVGSINEDSHPPNKLQVGISGAYRIQFGDHTEFHPTFKFGLAQYINPEYKQNKYSDLSYPLPVDTFYELGARLEFDVGTRSIFFFGLGVNNQRWRPKGLAQSENFKSKLLFANFSVGYKFALINFNK